MLAEVSDKIWTIEQHALVGIAAALFCFIISFYLPRARWLTLFLSMSYCGLAVLDAFGFWDDGVFRRYVIEEQGIRYYWWSGVTGGLPLVATVVGMIIRRLRRSNQSLEPTAGRRDAQV